MKQSASPTQPLPPSWMGHVGEEFEREYMVNLKAFLKQELDHKRPIFPHGSEIFSAFNLTPFDLVKVVIIGQDPYHGPGQAHGLCFSVKPGVRVPPSLQNIYKELNADLKLDIPNHGFLESWAKQGVLMLNSVLTVEKGKAGSHQGKGWENFTSKIVEVLNKESKNLVFFIVGESCSEESCMC